MSDDDTRKRLIALAWVAAFLVSGFLGGDSVVTMTRVGLFGQRPPLLVFHTVLRILIVVVALALLYVFQGRLEAHRTSGSGRSSEFNCTLWHPVCGLTDSRLSGSSHIWPRTVSSCFSRAGMLPPRSVK